MQRPTEARDGARVAIWDLPVRLVHWALVILIGFSWWSAETGRLDWHLWSGYAVLALVVFRIYWGFAGSWAARFSQFVKGPRATWAYARTLPRRTSAPSAGHNPIGAISIVAILLSLTTQVTTGLFSVDVDGLYSGPLAYMVSFELGRTLAEIHETSFAVLQALIVLHVAAVIFYLLYKRTNLIGPMITGRKILPADPGLPRTPIWRALLGVVLAALLAWLVAKGLVLG